MKSEIRRAVCCGAMASTIVTAMLLAAAPVAAVELPDKGVLHIKLGAVDQFLWTDKAGTPLAQPQAIIDKRTRTGLAKDACNLESPPGSTAPTPVPPTLVAISASGGVPGINSDSIGVFGGGSGSNARGVDCARVNVGESLTIALAGQLSAFTVKKSVLDIEVKQNAWIKAVATFDQKITNIELRSGTSIGQPVPAGTFVFNCNAQSGPDSGPDSSGADNCTWQIDVPWKSLKLTTAVGAWSLEGGADTGIDARLELSEISGILSCGQATIEAKDLTTGAIAIGTRLNNVTDDPQGLCTPIPYVLFWRNGTDIQFIKDDLDQDVAMRFKITWPDEAAPPVVDESVGVFGAIKLTQQEFVPGVPVPIDLCRGTPVYDPQHPGILTGLTPPVDGFPVQYGCSYDHDVLLPAEDTIRLIELIYLQGDWGASRTNQ